MKPVTLYFIGALIFSGYTGMACSCNLENFVSSAVAANGDVFEASLVCDYRDPDVAKVLDVRLYKFRIHRYWNGSYRSEYVIIAGDAVSTCGIDFEAGTRYVFRGQPAALHPYRLGAKRIYFANKCSAVPAAFIDAADFDRVGDAAIVNVSPPDLAEEPCSEFAKLEERLSDAEKKYAELAFSAESPLIKAANGKMFAQALLIAAMFIFLFRVSSRVSRLPFRTWLRGYFLTVAITLVTMATLTISGVITHVNVHESFGVQDMVWQIIGAGIGLVLLSSPSLAALHPAVRSRPYLQVTAFLLLPVAFLVQLIADDGLSAFTTGDTSAFAVLVVCFTYIAVIAVFSIKMVGVSR